MMANALLTKSLSIFNSYVNCASSTCRTRRATSADSSPLSPLAAVALASIGWVRLISRLSLSLPPSSLVLTPFSCLLQKYYLV